jgi:hypothetical protein
MNDYEPTEITPGETLEWRRSFADYNPADGWALVYYFRGAETHFDATATADGNSWKVTMVVPEDAVAGRVDWQAWVMKGDEERLAGKGVAAIGVSFKANSPVDNRTQAEKDLDAVRAALVPATSAGVQEYEIGGVGTNRRIRYYDKSAMLALETSLAQRVNAERRAAAHRGGAPYFKTIYPR